MGRRWLAGRMLWRYMLSSRSFQSGPSLFPRDPFATTKTIQRYLSHHAHLIGSEHCTTPTNTTRTRPGWRE